MHHVIEDLQRLQRASRRLLVGQRAAVILGSALAILLLLIGVDWLLRLPGPLRIALLIVGTTGLCVALATYLWKALTFEPSLTQIALRAERVLPPLSGRLASAMEFVRDGDDERNEMAARSVIEAETRLSGASLSLVMAPARTIRTIAGCVVVIAIFGLLQGLAPDGMRTGISRILLPLGSAAWPARTGVESRMHEVLTSAVHPRGQALAMRAQVTRGDDDQRIYAHYRLQIDGDYQAWRRILLTHQSDGMHERLVDADAEAIELYFETDDASTSRERIEIITPPAVLRATLNVDPPRYAQAHLPPLTSELGPGTDARSVTETPALAGSDIQLTLELNKPLPIPAAAAAREAWLRTTLGWDDQSQLPGFTVDPSDPSRWMINWQLADSRTLDLNLVDRYKLSVVDPVTYRILARKDQNPSVTITTPATDEVVLPGAMVPLVAEAQDDVALTQMAFEAELIPAVSDRSAGTTPDEGELSRRIIWTEQRSDLNAPIATLNPSLDLSQFELSEGDVVVITAIAADGFDLDGQQHEPARSVSRRLQIISELEYATQVRRQLSAVRQNAIRIESLQSELQDDVIDAGMQPGVERAQAQLGQRIADQTQRLDELEQAMQQNRLEDEQLYEVLRQSRDLLNYAGRYANEATQQMEQRAAEQRANNAQRSGAEQQSRQAQPEQGAADANADGQGEQAGDAQDQQQRSQGGDRAGEQSPGQAASGQQAGEHQQPGAEQEEDAERQPAIREPAPEDEPIVEAQQKVREELTDLIELLDRDEDTWVVTRRIEDLIDQQARLEQQTQQLGDETIGRSPEELTEDQRDAIEKIAEMQRDLSQQVQDLIEEARDRAEALEEVDRNASAGLRSAAETAEQREIDREMERAAEQAEQNQMQSARNSQQQARESLERMLEDIEETKRAKAQDLLRQLASMIDSIKQLISVQENELIALAQSVDAGDFSGRDRAMIRLNQNTVALAAEARAAGQESRRIARSLDRAGDAQGSAVVALRAQPVNAADALAAEEHSLDLLREALALAEEVAEQVQQDEVRRRREELLDAYRQAAEQEVALRTATLELAGNLPLNRRQLVDSRRYGATQDDIREALDVLRAQTSELLESPMFSLAHRRIDDWARQVTQQMTDGDVSVSVTDRQARIADSIGRLIAVLEETLTAPDEFVQNQQQQQQGEQGEQQGQQQQEELIPPLAELRLLRGMQEQIYEQTRALDARSDLEQQSLRDRLRELGDEQRELYQLGNEMLERLKEMSQQRPSPPPPTEGGAQ